MKALIIDDEKKARSLLSTILGEYCPEIEELKEAEDLPGGIKLINTFHPDVVFLDIEMPAYSGTQILDFFEPEDINFHIVFTTAYSEHAVKAFQMNAVDYLLKPLRPNQVKEAVAKVKDVLKKEGVSRQIEELKSAFEATRFSKIGLPISDGVLFVEFENIICMEADGMYTRVFTTNSGGQMVSKPLKYFVDLLENEPYFYRTHRSYLINIRHIKQYVRRDGNYIVMDNDHMVSISKEKKDEFLEIVNLL
ncbi:response regulator [bacterium SCSIO 12741]|nr:response regulator [bacterium SCSIO 12741]